MTKKKKSYNYKKQKSADKRRKINHNASQYKSEPQTKYFQFIHPCINQLKYKGYLSINQIPKTSEVITFYGASD